MTKGRHSYSANEKAAILLISLGEELASEIFQQLDEMELKKIMSAMAQLQRVDHQVVEELLSEFYEVLQQPSKIPVDAGRFAQNALLKAFPNDQGQQLAHELSQQVARLDAAELFTAEELYRIIQGEHPQTLALVLALIEPEKAAEVLKRFPTPLQLQVCIRVAATESVSAEMIAELNDHLREEATHMSANTKRKLGGTEKVAQILGALDSTASKQLLDKLEERDPDLTEEIREKLLTFDDLSKVTDKDFQAVLNKVPRDLLKVALRSCSNAMMEKVFQNLSTNAKQLLQDDLEALGKVKRSDMEHAQMQIIAIAQELEEQGIINLDIHSSEAYV